MNTADWNASPLGIELLLSLFLKLWDFSNF